MSEDKPKGHSPLKTLPPERQDQIAEHGAAHTLAETLAWLADQGIHTSQSALSRFLAWHRLRQQAAENQLLVKDLLADFAQENPDLSPNRLFELGQFFFSVLALQRQDPRAWHLTQQNAVRHTHAQIAWEKFQEARRQAEKSSEPPVGLTTEALEEIEQALRLM